MQFKMNNKQTELVLQVLYYILGIAGGFALGFVIGTVI